MAKKTDPIRNKYYKPLERTEKCESVLFYISALFSFTPLLLTQAQNPTLFIWSQIIFSVSVILLALTSIVIRLYLFPRAQESRYKDFISHAFGVHHNEKTKGYYNNSQTKPLNRVAAQTLENSFYSKNITEIMINNERIKIGVYFFIWLILLLNRNTELTTIVIITQIVFSEFLLVKWLNMELLRVKFEKTFDSMLNLFKTKQNGKTFETHTLETIGIYEMAKAHGCITLSDRIFSQKSKGLDQEWKDIRKNLNI